MTSSWAVGAISGLGEVTGAWRAVTLDFLGCCDPFICGSHFWGCCFCLSLLEAGLQGLDVSGVAPKLQEAL